MSAIENLRWQDGARSLARRRPHLDRKLKVGAILLAIIVAIGVAAPLITPYPPNQQDLLNALAAPSSQHWLGTDDLGRDVLSRIIYAIRIDLPVAFLCAFLPMLLGTFLGALAGYFGGLLDAVISAAITVLRAFPIYVFLIALSFALGAGVNSIVVSYVLVGWVVYARLIRAEVLRMRGADFVAAAEVGGLSRTRVLFSHLLPNSYRQTATYLPADIVLAVVVFSAFSFIGLGVQGEQAEWGAMINEAQPFVQQEWWLAAAPGAAIVLLGLALLLIGDSLEERLPS